MNSSHERRKGPSLVDNVRSEAFDHCRYRGHLDTISNWERNSRRETSIFFSFSVALPPLILQLCGSEYGIQCPALIVIIFVPVICAPRPFMNIIRHYLCTINTHHYHNGSWCLLSDTNLSTLRSNKAKISLLLPLGLFCRRYQQWILEHRVPDGRELNASGPRRFLSGLCFFACKAQTEGQQRY